VSRNDALQVASFQGYEMVVELLLDKGANVNAQGGGYGNALYAASVEGHEKIVELLLDKGANVSVNGQEGGL
jgi:ankyrin repeat protein